MSTAVGNRELHRLDSIRPVSLPGVRLGDLRVDRAVPVRDGGVSTDQSG